MKKTQPLLRHLVLEFNVTSTYNQPSLVGYVNPVVFHDLATLREDHKWQFNQPDIRYTGGGPEHNAAAEILLPLLVKLGIQDANVIFRDVYASESASASTHIDDSCFIRPRTFIVHFGRAVEMKFGTHAFMLQHCGIYGFDGGIEHGLPPQGRYSLSIRSWGEQTVKATKRQDSSH